VRDAGMRPSLFTNGIRATRPLLRALAENGLADVAFHVDMTQRRRGYASERELMALREEYLERARDLPLGVIFNTTVFAGNFADVPEIVRFFRERAGRVTLASFQLQADTGRSVLGGRPPFLTPDALASQISRGAGQELAFGFPAVGHGDCNRYVVCLEAGGRLYNLFAATPFMAEFVRRTRPLAFERGRPGRTLEAVIRVVLADPRLWTRALAYLAAKLWEMKGGLFRSRGRVNKLSFFIHNFMDASALEPERCRACVFMVATREGPLSMCLHNAKRERYILPAFTSPSPSVGKTNGTHSL
ncbi:MAG: radical SAM protein, partial [bacterium]